MRLIRTTTGLVSAGLLGITPLAMATSADAAATLPTTTAAQPSATQVVYGADISINVDLASSTGASIYKGTETLFVMPAGSSTWTPIATETAGSSFYDVKPKSNATYKVVYSGYTATTASEDTFTASESAPFTVGVTRNVTIGKAKAKLTIKGKVKPSYKNKKVQILRKKGKRYVKYRTVKTNKQSRFQVRLPAAGGGKKLYFKIVIPGSTQFAGYSEVWYTYSYRQAAKKSA